MEYTLFHRYSNRLEAVHKLAEKHTYRYYVGARGEQNSEFRNRLQREFGRFNRIQIGSEINFLH